MRVSRPLCGAVLAAGAGSRAGGPKALRRGPEGVPWLVAACERLQAAGCDPVYAVLGAAAADAARLVPGYARPLVVADWAQGASRSLRAALDAAERGGAVALAITLVDVPAESPDALRRLIAAAEQLPGGLADALVRAGYDGRPGHPVLIGRTHWSRLAGELQGDSGARAYLHRNGALTVECADLGSGSDVDGPEDPAERTDRGHARAEGLGAHADAPASGGSAPAAPASPASS